MIEILFQHNLSVYADETFFQTLELRLFLLPLPLHHPTSTYTYKVTIALKVRDDIPLVLKYYFSSFYLYMTLLFYFPILYFLLNFGLVNQRILVFCFRNCSSTKKFMKLFTYISFFSIILWCWIFSLNDIYNCFQIRVTNNSS